MAKYLLLLVESEEAYATAGEAELNATMEAHNAFSAEVAGFGASILGGEALQPTPTATYLRGTRSDDVHVVDNPSPELKEVLGGYYLIEAPSDEVALEVAKRCPAGAGYVEVRPIWDFGG